ncbi:MAG TPA: hypothetical protein VFE62_05390 [Gemmataceae bacterium]|nr:hypothetical protein [Gemmataceae bacterium]
MSAGAALFGANARAQPLSKRIAITMIVNIIKGELRTWRLSAGLLQRKAGRRVTPESLLIFKQNLV